MITPLAQRQIFQTANVEAVRVAHEVSEQLQREQAQKQAADQSAAEDQASVRVIAGSDRIRTEERHERRRQQNPQHEAEEPQEGEDAQPGDGESHLDFLA